LPGWAVRRHTYLVEAEAARKRDLEGRGGGRRR